MKKTIKNNILNRLYLSVSIVFVLLLILLCLCSCNNGQKNDKISNTPGETPAATTAGAENPTPETTPDVSSNRNFKKVTVDSKELSSEGKLDELIQHAIESAEKEYLAYEIETEGILDNSLLEILKGMGEPMTGRYYDTFICYHIPIADVDLEELKTLYNHSSVKAIRILSRSSYDYIEKLYVMSLEVNGLISYDEMETAIRGLIEYSEDEMDYLIFSIKINGPVDGVLLKALSSFDDNEKFEQSAATELSYKVPFEDIDLTVLKILCDHPSVSKIDIGGKLIDLPL